MKKIIKLFKKQQEIVPFLNNLDSKNLLVTSTTKNHNVLLSATKYIETEDTIIYVAPNLYKATYIYESLCELVGVEHVNLFVTDEIVAVEALAISNEFKFERMHTLNSIIKGEKKIIVTCISSFLRPLISKEIYESNILKFEKGQTIDVNYVIKKLINMGYKRTPSTTQTGDFSVRGEILDIFPLNNDKPYRIDLFDDEIDYIKTFDPNNQKSLDFINDISIFPINELIYEYKEEIIKTIENLQKSKEMSEIHQKELEFELIESKKLFKNKNESLVDLIKDQMKELSEKEDKIKENEKIINVNKQKMKEFEKVSKNIHLYNELFW